MVGKLHVLPFPEGTKERRKAVVMDCQFFLQECVLWLKRGVSKNERSEIAERLDSLNGQSSRHPPVSMTSSPFWITHSHFPATPPRELWQDTLHQISESSPSPPVAGRQFLSPQQRQEVRQYVLEGGIFILRTVGRNDSRMMERAEGALRCNICVAE